MSLAMKEVPRAEVRPDHYGGEANPFEPRKIIRHYNLSPNLANVIKYVLRAGKKKNVPMEEDLKKAITYLSFELEDLTFNNT